MPKEIHMPNFSKIGVGLAPPHHTFYDFGLVGSKNAKFIYISAVTLNDPYNFYLAYEY